MKKNTALTNILAMLLVLALMASAAPVGAADDLRSGYSTVRDWNSTITGAAPTPTPTPAQAGPCDWSGRWKTNWAGMSLSQTGSQVSGTYGLMGERITGTVSGNTLIGTWSDKPSYSPPTDAGDVEFTMAADCNSFTGRWRYGSEGDWDGRWTGTRIDAAPTVDSDGDGVPDDKDNCPNTPAGTSVDLWGCSLQVLRVDSDGDGVPDIDDLCSGTPAGTPVDSTGCPLAQDSDGDGVPDSQDLCPGTPAGALVDAQGCEVVQDSDGDGVADVYDWCPGTPAGTVVDVQGCALVDSDGDGVPDVDDWCTNTPAGTPVDSTGCPLVVQGDSDGDGVPDVDDWCTNTPAGTPVDSTGCPLVVQDDSDGDGVPDADDWCSGTPAGAVVDANGCEVAQADKDDEDGVPDIDDDCEGTPAGAVVNKKGCSLEQIEQKNKQKVMLDLQQTGLEEKYKLKLTGDKAKNWAKNELKLLNEVLNKLPPKYLKHCNIKEILRVTVDTEGGKQNPKVLGDCDMDTHVIRIYDAAGGKKGDFGDSDKNFKGTLYHEFAHLFQTIDPLTGKRYTTADVDDNPLMKAWNKDVGSGWRKMKDGKWQSGWKKNEKTGKWEDVALVQTPRFLTSYASQDPYEDMAESVMMYYMNPAKLKKDCPDKHKFIEEKIFEVKPKP